MTSLRLVMRTIYTDCYCELITCGNYVVSRAGLAVKILRGPTVTKITRKQSEKVRFHVVQCTSLSDQLVLRKFSTHADSLLSLVEYLRLGFKILALRLEIESSDNECASLTGTLGSVTFIIAKYSFVFIFSNGQVLCFLLILFENLRLVSSLTVTLYFFALTQSKESGIFHFTHLARWKLCAKNVLLCIKLK